MNLDQSTLNSLKKRILDISYPRKLSHLGSCLTTLPIIVEIYEKKQKNDKFILSAGHAHLAHLVVMEYYGQLNAEETLDRFGIHCDMRAGCDCSSGSLGIGLSIAAGMALADRNRNVYVLTTDGEMQEGICHETAEVMWNEKITNLKVYVNCNGYGAYDPIDYHHLKRRFDSYYDQNISFKYTEDNLDSFPFLQGQSAHYAVMSDEDYKLALEVLK